jgi:PAS domain S-box-containing protein
VDTVAGKTKITMDISCGEFVFSILFSPIRDASYVNIYGIEITERKRLEENLEKEQQELKLIVDSSPIMVFYKDNKGKFIRINKTLCEVLEVPEEELVGKTVFDLYSAKIAQGMTNDDQEVIKSGHPKINIIEQYESASGLRWVQTDKIPTCDKNGIPFGLIGFAQDITERKQAEETIKKAEEKYRSIFENAIEGIFQTTPDGRFISANTALAHMLGYNAPEELIRSITNLMNQIYVDPDRRAELRRIFKSQDKVEGFEYEAYRKDGQVVWISNNIRAVRNEKGELLFYEGTGIDITEKKNLQTEIMQADRLSTIGELAAGVAHEINNPINGIINYAQMLIDQTQDPGGENDIPQRIIKEGERIASIVTNLLMFAKDRREGFRSIPIQTPLNGVLDLMGTQLKKDGIRITVKLPPDLSQVLINSQQIQQVFLNLLSNTRYALNQKYPGDHTGKALNISGKKIINNQGRPQIRLNFRDQGTGIPKAFLDKIFDPFFTTKLAEKGTGLGLSISRKIIQDHGGRLWLESREGEYTKAIVELPAAETEKH